ncbi:hypothetical protein UT300003_32800 [Clostridium sardiniense]
MRDILDRVVKEGDLVVVKPTGRYSRGLDLGIWNGKSVKCKRVTASYSEVFLIENPSEKELEYKENLLKQFEKEELEAQQEKERRKALTRIPKKDLIIGQAYLDEKGKTYVYLGKGKYRSNYYDSSTEGEYKEGYLYIGVSSWYEKYFGNNFDTLKHTVCNKNPKKLVSVREGFKLDINDKKLFAEEIKSVGYWSSSRKYEVEIILE